VYAVSLINFDGTISWINDAFTKITGYSFAEAIGKKQGTLLLGPESDEATLEELRQAFYRHIPFQGEILCYTKHQEKKWLFVSAQPVYDEASGLYKYFFIQMDITEQKKIVQQLEEYSKISTAAIIKAQEKERTKLGQELHDNVNQILTSVKLYVELCRDNVGDKTKLLERSSQLLQDVITELRSISHQLAAPPPEEINLEESIKELAKDFTDTRKFEIELHTEAIKGLKVKEEIQITVYRILQEHLVNILKHAQASLVDIHTSVMDDELVIKVIDDGKGFDMNEKRTGIGLLNIKNRAESVNGSLVINSKPGLGCVLIATIPLA
jgi:PAS domain S-box-containing protein